MQEHDKVDIIIYRVREHGLEVFLVNEAPPETTESWLTPVAGEALSAQTKARNAHCIELEMTTSPDGIARKTIAVEADWHEIPSLRALMYEDYRVAKEKAKQHISDLFHPDKGAFFVVKEAVKRVMPHQYALLKELKEVLVEKNSTKYI
jgi:hypothetical protein